MLFVLFLKFFAEELSVILHHDLRSDRIYFLSKRYWRILRVNVEKSLSVEFLDAAHVTVRLDLFLRNSCYFATCAFYILLRELTVR